MMLFGWMKLVFEWWVMIGMVFVIDWVDKFWELVRFGVGVEV